MFHILRAAKAQMSERHCVYCHERQECSKIQDFNRTLPTHGERTCVSEKANDSDVIARIPAFHIEMSENFPGQKVVAPHAVKQTYRTQVASQSTSQTRNQQDHAKRREQPIAAYHLRDVETDFNDRVPGYESWWDVAIA